MATEDNAEVLDPPVAEEPIESPEEMDTPQTDEVTEEPDESSEELETLRKENETLKKQKEHWRGKYEKAEKVKGKPEPKDSDDGEFRERVEFLLANREISQNEYDHLAAVALRDSGKVSMRTLQDAMESEKDYLSFLRKKADNQRKSPGSTSSSVSSKLGKSPEEIANMKPEEHRAYEEQILRAEERGGI